MPNDLDEGWDDETWFGDTTSPQREVVDVAMSLAAAGYKNVSTKRNIITIETAQGTTLQVTVVRTASERAKLS